LLQILREAGLVGLGAHQEPSGRPAHRRPRTCSPLSKIFDLDWATGLKTLPSPKTELLAPTAFAAGRMVRLNWGDYAEV